MAKTTVAELERQIRELSCCMNKNVANLYDHMAALPTPPRDDSRLEAIEKTLECQREGRHEWETKIVADCKWSMGFKVRFFVITSTCKRCGRTDHTERNIRFSWGLRRLYKWIKD